MCRPFKGVGENRLNLVASTNVCREVYDFDDRRVEFGVWCKSDGVPAYRT